MDKFPQAFRRFEKTVNVDKIDTFKQLAMAFASWAGRTWKGSPKQIDALEKEAQRIGIPLEGIRIRHVKKGYRPVAGVAWRFETVKVKGREQPRYRDMKTGRFIKKPQ
jgi:hypothetical protein